MLMRVLFLLVAYACTILFVHALVLLKCLLVAFVVDSG
jgi:hypothetical protein